MDKWVGKVAIVTGASAGIGAATALALAREGMVVVGVARRLEKLQEMQKELGKAKGKLHVKQLDVSKIDEIPQFFEEIKKEFGGVDVLVNNAGIFRHGSLTESSTQDMKDVIFTNVLGLAVASREAIQQMKAKNQPGHVININSVGGHKIPTIPGMKLDIYMPSKYAVTAISEISRYEMAIQDAKIKITSISPGGVETDIFEAGGIKNVKEWLKNFDALRAEDVADAIKYVLSTPETVLITELTLRHVKEKF